MLGITERFPYSTDQLRALRRLRELGQAISENTQRLSTLKRINSAKDDPKGLIHASMLERELSAAEATTNAIGRAQAQLSTADAAASEIVTQLQSARTLALEAAGLTSQADVVANQIELDQILSSINNTARVSFTGQRMLDGSSSFRATGVDYTKIKDVDILSKTSDDAITVAINVTSAAKQATDSYTGGSLMGDTTILIEGPDGSASVSMNSGASTTDIETAVNATSYLTGVTATRKDASQVDFATVDYGSQAAFTITATEGYFSMAGGGTATGSDAEATVNGSSLTADGTTLSYTTADVAAVIELDPSASGAISSFELSGSGLNFVVGINAHDTQRIGMPNLTTTSLGGATGNLDAIRSGGQFSLTSGNAAEAIQVIDEALAEALRGQAVIGSFQSYTLDSASRTVTSMIENSASALSAIQDTDVAIESAQLANNLLLQESTLNVLSIANSRNESVLTLLNAIAFR